MSSAYDHRHQAQRMAHYADKAEFQAVTIGSTVVGAGIYDRRVAGALDDFREPNPQGEEIWQSEDLRYDEAVGNIHEEIERRAGIMGEAYPFTLDQGFLTHSQSETSVYEFLLSICSVESITTGEYVSFPRVFERMSAKIVAAFFGEETEHIHTGWPRDEGVGISFREAMETVAERTGEWVWNPQDGLPDNPVAEKDGGCDFVVWPSMTDGRQIGQLFILGQCACGSNWESKLSDLDLKKFQRWFNPLSIVDPVRTFATPHHVTDAMLREASRGGGLFFDRARLTLTAHRNSEQVIDSNVTRMMRDAMELAID